MLSFLVEAKNRAGLSALQTEFSNGRKKEYGHGKKKVGDKAENGSGVDDKNGDPLKQFLQKTDLMLATRQKAAKPATVTETVLSGLENPVLLLPPYWDGAYGASVLVVWDNSQCAHKIVQASRTILAHATLLHLIAPEGAHLPYGLLPPVMLEEQRVGLPFSLARVVHTAATARLAYPADMVVLGFDWAGQQHTIHSTEALPNSPASAVLQSVRVPLLLWGGGYAQQAHT